MTEGEKVELIQYAGKASDVPAYTCMVSCGCEVLVAIYTISGRTHVLAECVEPCFDHRGMRNDDRRNEVTEYARRSVQIAHDDGDPPFTKRPKRPCKPAAEPFSLAAHTLIGGQP